MKNLLLGGVAALAIVASPLPGLAQSSDRGSQSENPRSTDSGGSGRAESGPGSGRMESGGAGPERGGERGSSSGADMRGDRPSAADPAKEAQSARPSAGDAPLSREKTERSGGAASSDTKPSSDTRSMERDEKLRERTERAGGAPDTNERPDKQRTGGDATRERSNSERSTTTERSDERSSERSSSKTSVNISTEKRSTIRETIVSSPSVRKVSRSTVGVDLRVGVSVPRTVTIERLPPRIVEIVPEYADYSYFVLDDGAIVIVDPATYDVVYVIEA